MVRLRVGLAVAAVVVVCQGLALGQAPLGDAATIQLLRQAAKHNDANAQVELGLMYDEGRGVPQDLAEAAKWYRKAAEQKSVYGQHNLALMYRRGTGVNQSDQKAVAWFRKAAEQNGADSQVELGWMYSQGRGVPRDHTEAVRWYREAAQQNHPYAQYNLGISFMDGRGSPRDDREAVKWFRKAAEQNYAPSQLKLGRMLERGRGVARDDAEAVKWYRKSAEQGEALAQFNLGRMYGKGRGVPQDDAEAARWYRKAAEQNLAHAQSELGLIYQEGRGVPQDQWESLKWFHKAADQGDDFAKIQLTFLEIIPYSVALFNLSVVLFIFFFTLGFLKSRGDRIAAEQKEESPLFRIDDSPAHGRSWNRRSVAKVILCGTTLIWMILGRLGILFALGFAVGFKGANGHAAVWIVFAAILSFPLVCCVSILASWLAFRAERLWSAYVWTLLPLTNFAVVGGVFAWAILFLGRTLND